MKKIYFHDEKKDKKNVVNFECATARVNIGVVQLFLGPFGRIPGGKLDEGLHAILLGDHNAIYLSERGADRVDDIDSDGVESVVDSVAENDALRRVLAVGLVGLVFVDELLVERIVEEASGVGNGDGVSGRVVHQVDGRGYFFELNEGLALARHQDYALDDAVSVQRFAQVALGRVLGEVARMHHIAGRRLLRVAERRRRRVCLHAFVWRRDV
ncbi:hypothetical protein BpHYR1_021446 [Brachionus plicatilis]|uniref:Uncharacterized protein n=1 Tax=Brachionus plicatilis TaxID=10195 RepID=A0A3M7SV12_BRAPC|nr:hypothetical protein BpHYR1_021446 [Brachionus plicatilis]